MFSARDVMKNAYTFLWEMKVILFYISYFGMEGKKENLN